MAENKRKLETPKIRHDLPLTLEEKANFNFDAFASTMARLIASTETRTPLVIGISGPWGSGKTTLLRRIEAMLRNQSGFFDPQEKNQFRPCKVTWFDAWKYQDESELLVALVRKILQEMQAGGLKDKFKAVLGRDEVAPQYDFVEMFINAFQFKFGGLGAELQVRFDPQKHRSESPFTTHTAFFDYFDTAFENLLALWVHGKDKYPKINDEEGALVIFIDDLDRCLPQKTVQVLEAIKLFLDKKGCVFVIGADSDRVRNAVKEHYKFSEGHESGEYLEKIIQLRFNLPPAPEQEMEEYVRYITEDGTLSDHWRLVTIGAGHNPRKVKVFLNDLSLRWAIWKNVWQTGHVEYDDFVRWEVWMGSAPKFRLRVHRVYDKEDLSILTNLVEAAFRWAQGEDDAIASFREDVTDQMHRVVREILPFRERFTPDVLESLLHLTAPPQVRKEMPVEKGAEIPTEQEEITLDVASIKQKVVVRGAKIEAVEVGARNGIEIFTFANIPFVRVPAGKFIMGSKEDDHDSFEDEYPQHILELPEFYMARFPVTNEQYNLFVKKTGKEHPFSSWQNKQEHPVVGVSWEDSQAFVNWMNEDQASNLPEGFHYRLPSEAEWEKAARGLYANIYPWGNEWDPLRCNSREVKIGGTSPVGQFSPVGDSPFGCADISGNVWEWTRSLWGKYPYPAEFRERFKRENESAPGGRVLRGGSFSDNRGCTRCACHRNGLPASRGSYIGFRICVSPSK